MKMLMINEEKEAGGQKQFKENTKSFAAREGGKERGRKKVKANSLKTLAKHLGVDEHTSGANAHRGTFNITVIKDSLHDSASHNRAHKVIVVFDIHLELYKLCSVSAQLQNDLLNRPDQWSTDE